MHDPEARFSRDSQSTLALTLFGRVLIYGSPLVASAFAMSYVWVMETYAPIAPFVSYGAMIIGNAVLGAIGAAAGVILLTGRAGLRVAGAVAYAVLSLFIYGFACGFAVLLTRL